MRIIFVGKKYILKDTLPINIIDNYWLIDKKQKDEKKLLNIRMNSDKYEILSSDYSKVINPQKLNITEGELSEIQLKNSIIGSIILEENKMYPIFIEQLNEIFILFCMPDYEANFTHMDIMESKEITIGNSEKNSIVYRAPLINSVHAKIYKFNGKWSIENKDSKFGVFVNNYPVYENTKNIFNGDIIFIMGLIIIMIKDSLYINNPQNNVFLSERCFSVNTLEEKMQEQINMYISDKTNTISDKPIEYYSRSPRMIPPIKKEKIKIDEPPELSDSEQRPMILTLGPSLAMGIMMFASLYSTIQGVKSGTSTATETLIGFISEIAMLIAMILFPVLDVKWDKKSRRRYEQKRQKKYKQYLEQKNIKLKEIKEKQTKILYENYLSTPECVNVITSQNPRLWERKPEDKDFLSIRVGLGKVPLNIDLAYPQEKFAMVDDNLRDELNKIIDNSQNIEKAPVVISLVKNNISAVVENDKQFVIKYIKNMILQLTTFQSYDDLKLVFLIDNKNSEEWQYAKMLPHVWDNTKKIRYFADNYDNMNEISQTLIEEINDRVKNAEKNTNEDTVFSPYYLIITDNYKKIENLGIITEILKNKKNIGFSLLCITEDVFQLPSRCRTFIDVRKKNKGIVYEDGIDQTNQTDIAIEPLNAIYYEKISQKLANTPIKLKTKGVSLLPNSYTFLEMFNVGNIEQLDIIGRWKKNDSTLSLKTPIGIDSDGTIISLDAHEKFHGPHGLIAGSTGSGKSEFIITYILSLAINYHPDDVTFLLIDYKGGGLAGAFQKNYIKLPHLVGTITNIDKHGLERSLVSVQSELKRRQMKFNEARNMTDEGTIDIYKYQKLYHDGVVKEPISHLFIICDEFAELKQQQPDFMEELMSVSRIGRSLGVHLILATQKPAGVVNDQIRSNSKFGICLKVQDKADSSDVIERPDAAFLRNPGQFYLRVGQNEYFTLGQSGWAGASYIPSDSPKKKLDNSVEFISDIGETIKKVDNAKQQSIEDMGEQLTNILRNICDIAEEEQIKAEDLWLEDIPQDIYIKNLREKYNEKPNNNEIGVVIGEYDDPANQKQGLVKFELSKRENIMIYGNAESGKETLLSTMIYDAITSYTPEQVQFYILDFGSEALKIFKKSPHVGDVAFMGEDDKLETFFRMIQSIIKERKQTLADYNGDYNLYIEKGNKMPIIVIVINNYETFNENYEDKYDDLFLTLTREGAKSGVIFAVTLSSTGTMRYRTTQNFSQIVTLQLNSDDEYYSIFDNVKNKRPTHLFGRGLIRTDNIIYEFQTSKICEHINYNEHIENTIKELNNKYEINAMPIPTMPEKIEIKDMKKYLKDITKVPIGLTKRELYVHTYDFTKRFMIAILSKNMADSIALFTNICEEIKDLENVNIRVLDAEKERKNKKKAYNDFIKDIKNDMKSEEKFTICAIIGIDRFISDGVIDETEFSDFLEKVKEKEKHCFIIIENPERLEEHDCDDWYSNFMEQNSGIWVGNGIDSQTIVDSDFSLDGLDNNCGDSFGYAIDYGVATLIKFIGLEEEGDEDE